MDEQIVLSREATRIILPIVLRALARKEKRLKEEAQREQSQLSAQVGDSSERR